MTLDELNKQQDEFKRLKYPNVPEYALSKTKNKDNGANSLTSSIVKFLELNNHHVSRVNTMGVMKNGKYRKGGGTLGASDLSIIMKGKNGVIAWEVEVKFGKDKQSDVQKKYQASVERAGGIYSIVSTFDDFQMQYNKLMEL